ncbi:MAG: DsbA family protein, partial [Anaerolineales bacterium]
MVALILVALLILPGLSSSGDLIVPTPLARPATTDTSMGDPQARVHIEEFSDFQCPYCRRFTEEVEPKLIAEYVDSGKVYFTYRHFPILGTASIRAAEASLCAR